MQIKIKDFAQSFLSVRRDRLSDKKIKADILFWEFRRLIPNSFIKPIKKINIYKIFTCD